MGEFEYIHWLRQRSHSTSRVLVGPGDDCAVLRPTDAATLITTDMLMDGTHFRLSETLPRCVGRKAMAVNLSDIAAMGGVPTAAVVSLALPRRGAREIAEEIYLGMRQMADTFDTAIVGGDTNSWDFPLVLNVTVFGIPGPHGPILRSCARPGDWILVTGPLGGSILGRHLEPKPRIHEALALQDHCTPHAMIDISDGLAQDLHHICEESSVGAVLRAEAIPIHADVLRMPPGKTPLQHALTDGEDFELAFTVSPEEGRVLLERQPIPGITLVHIGEILAERVYHLEEEGVRRPLAPAGFVHSFETEP